MDGSDLHNTLCSELKQQDRLAKDRNKGSLTKLGCMPAGAKVAICEMPFALISSGRGWR